MRGSQATPCQLGFRVHETWGTYQMFLPRPNAYVTSGEPPVGVRSAMDLPEPMRATPTVIVINASNLTRENEVAKEEGRFLAEQTL
jgi:hypothetical protein